jgi:hypothetical protein
VCHTKIMFNLVELLQCVFTWSLADAAGNGVQYCTSDASCSSALYVDLQALDTRVSLFHDMCTHWGSDGLYHIYIYDMGNVQNGLQTYSTPLEPTLLPSTLNICAHSNSYVAVHVHLAEQ